MPGKGTVLLIVVWHKKFLLRDHAVSEGKVSWNGYH